jgi:formylmethanofuran dehydrogenase subunit B
LTILRLLVRAVIRSGTTDAVDSVPIDWTEALAPQADLWRDLARRMCECRCGVVFFGLGLSQSLLGHISVSELLKLVQELNAQTHFYARRLRIHGDVTGADNVLCWQTGFPFSVNLGRGYARYNPGEFSAHEVLARNEVDACLLVGTETLDWFSPAANARLRTLPSIVLDYPNVATPFTPTVLFRTAVYGVHEPGTIYRMDEVPIPLRVFLESDYPTDEDVLERIAAACRLPSGG